MLPTDPDAVAVSKGGSNHRRLSTAGDDVVLPSGGFDRAVGVEDAAVIRRDLRAHRDLRHVCDRDLDDVDSTALPGHAGSAGHAGEDRFPGCQQPRVVTDDEPRAADPTISERLQAALPVGLGRARLTAAKDPRLAVRADAAGRQEGTGEDVPIAGNLLLPGVEVQVGELPDGPILPGRDLVVESARWRQTACCTSWMRYRDRRSRDKCGVASGTQRPWMDVGHGLHCGSAADVGRRTVDPARSPDDPGDPPGAGPPDFHLGDGECHGLLTADAPLQSPGVATTRSDPRGGTAFGKQRRERQSGARVAAAPLPKTRGRSFHAALDRLLAGHRFDATTIQANASMRPSIRQESGKGSKDDTENLVKKAGLDDPADEEFWRSAPESSWKKVWNDNRENPHDSDALFTRMNDGTPRMADKVEHTVDLDTDIFVAATVRTGTRSRHGRGHRHRDRHGGECGASGKRPRHQHGRLRHGLPPDSSGHARCGPGHAGLHPRACVAAATTLEGRGSGGDPRCPRSTETHAGWAWQGPVGAPLRTDRTILRSCLRHRRREAPVAAKTREQDETACGDRRGAEPVNDHVGAMRYWQSAESPRAPRASPNRLDVPRAPPVGTERHGNAAQQPADKVPPWPVTRQNVRFSGELRAPYPIPEVLQAVWPQAAVRTWVAWPNGCRRRTIKTSQATNC